MRLKFLIKTDDNKKKQIKINKQITYGNSAEACLVFNSYFL